MANEKKSRILETPEWINSRLNFNGLPYPNFLDEMKNFTPSENKHDDLVTAFSYSIEALLELEYVPSWIHRLCNWLRLRFPNGPLIQL